MYQATFSSCDTRMTKQDACIRGCRWRIKTKQSDPWGKWNDVRWAREKARPSSYSVAVLYVAKGMQAGSSSLIPLCSTDLLGRLVFFSRPQQKNDEETPCRRQRHRHPPALFPYHELPFARLRLACNLCFTNGLLTQQYGEAHRLNEWLKGKRKNMMERQERP